MGVRSRNSAIEQFVFDESSVFLLVTDRGGTVRRANSYAQRITGERLVGRNLRDILIGFSPHQDLESVIAQQSTRHVLDITVPGGFPRTFSFRFVDCEEEILVLGEQPNEDNDLLHANLLGLNQEAGNLNRMLQKQNAELERLNELKNRFIGTAAHDLRNPLGAIRNLSEALSRDARAAGRDEEIEILDAVHESSSFMLSLVEDLLSVATIDSGEIRLDFETSDMNELVSSNVKLNQILACERGVELCVRRNELVREVRVDRAKIQQVLNNLISNAIKFSPRDSVVSISVACADEAITLSVEDAGPGIAPEEISKLFKPFSRTSTQATDGGPSTGLGLYIAKRIVDAHGGTIWAESEPGVRTTFHVSLPLAPDS